MLEDVAAIRCVVFACKMVDLRKGINGLAMIIGDKYNKNPFEKGTLFLFRGKRSDRCKGLLFMLQDLCFSTNASRINRHQQRNGRDSNSYLLLTVEHSKLYISNRCNDTSITSGMIAKLRFRFFKEFAYSLAFWCKYPKRKVVSMCQKFNPDELNTMDSQTKDDVTYQIFEKISRHTRY